MTQQQPRQGRGFYCVILILIMRVFKIEQGLTLVTNQFIPPWKTVEPAECRTVYSALSGRDGSKNVVEKRSAGAAQHNFVGQVNKQLRNWLLSITRNELVKLHSTRSNSEHFAMFWTKQAGQAGYSKLSSYESGRQSLKEHIFYKFAVQPPGLACFKFKFQCILVIMTSLVSTSALCCLFKMLIRLLGV